MVLLCLCKLQIGFATAQSVGSCSRGSEPLCGSIEQHVAGVAGTDHCYWYLVLYYQARGCNAQSAAMWHMHVFHAEGL